MRRLLARIAFLVCAIRGVAERETPMERELEEADTRER